MIQTLHDVPTWMAFVDSMHSQGQLEWGAPIAGIGQGNRAGPQIWAVVSFPLFKIIWDDRFLALILGAISGTSHKLVGFTFVDYMNLCLMDVSDEPWTVTKMMQDLVKTWEVLLSATGGT